MDRIMSWITKSGDVRVAEDKKWLNSLRSAVIGPHPSPPPLRQGREILYTVTEFRMLPPLPQRGRAGVGADDSRAEGMIERTR